MSLTRKDVLNIAELLAAIAALRACGIRPEQITPTGSQPATDETPREPSPEAQELNTRFGSDMEELLGITDKTHSVYDLKSIAYQRTYGDTAWPEKRELGTIVNPQGKELDVILGENGSFIISPLESFRAQLESGTPDRLTAIGDTWNDNTLGAVLLYGADEPQAERMFPDPRTVTDFIRLYAGPLEVPVTVLHLNLTGTSHLGWMDVQDLGSVPQFDDNIAGIHLTAPDGNLQRLDIMVNMEHVITESAVTGFDVPTILSSVLTSQAAGAAAVVHALENGVTDVSGLNSSYSSVAFVGSLVSPRITEVMAGYPVTAFARSVGDYILQDNNYRLEQV